MDHQFSTVDEYIAGYNPDLRIILEKVRAVIQRAVPPETIETISYQMPTYRWNGNLIHFAMNRAHLGIYPGPAAITAFADELKGYKTSKGAIQLPLDKPIPDRLIGALVRFNTERLNDKIGPDWRKYHARWAACIEVMEQLIVKTDLTKAFKWGTDVYTYNGKNVIGWGGFKDFFSLWFYNGVFLEDRENVLVNASEGKTKALRQWRFTDVGQMDERKILAYIEESVQTIRDGKEIKPQRASPKGPEGVLKTALDSDREFNTAFAGLTPGRQREYIGYIEEAKQETTKQNRIAKIRPLVLAGKGLHDKYKN